MPADVPPGVLIFRPIGSFSMIDPATIQEVRARFDEVTRLMSTPEIAVDPVKMARFGKEHTELSRVVRVLDGYESMRREIADLRHLLRESPDPEIEALAREELEVLESRLPEREEEVRLCLLPKDPEDSKDAIVEIRAGTGGDEAGLFVGDLFRMYSRFAETRGWRIDVMSISEGGQGGYKEIIFGLGGNDAFGSMKYESGVHRVQRVPATESQGRIHTSAATVAVLPEAEEVDVDISPEELEIDVYRSSGPGGQSVNTTDSAVRITHKPTGLVVTCQDEKSQLKNKDKALRVLRSRLYELERARLDAERSEARRSMVGSGDRSAKIRTYNWPQNRVTDHRLEGEDKNRSLETILDGRLDPLVRALRLEDNARRLAGLSTRKEG